MASDSENDTPAPDAPAAKRKTAKAAGAKPVAGRNKQARAAQPDGETADADAVTGDAASGSLRKKDLLDRVGAKSKAKKKDIKDVVEATLLVLGEALAAGEELNLPPLGKAKINRQKGVTGGDMYIIRLRRSTGKAAGGGDATETLAEAED